MPTASASWATAVFNGTNLPEQIVASNVTAIAAGDGHSLFIKSDGSLWAMGYNSSGELGDGGICNQTNRPEQIVASNVTAIAAGSDHSLFLKRDGSLWAMGNGDSGQLGDGGFNGTNRPEQIVAGNVMAIAAGDSFSLFLKRNGSLWAMGFNGYMGDGIFINTQLPEQIVAGLPNLVISFSAPNRVVVSWTNTGSYTLQQNSNLAGGTWITNGSSITNSSGTNSITISPPTGNLFFRLME